MFEDDDNEDDKNKKPKISVHKIDITGNMSEEEQKKLLDELMGDVPDEVKAKLGEFIKEAENAPEGATGAMMVRPIS